MELDECRDRIDRIDRDLAHMLELRMTIVAAVAAYKAEHGMAVYDADREAKVLDKIAAYMDDKAMIPYVQRIYQCIMDESKKFEEKRMEP